MGLRPMGLDAANPIVALGVLAQSDLGADLSGG
ncbi:MAG: hypothetical protein JWM88_108 [Verrucomicrobia bacterium]|nr:hypothetical protein [Verrucomicrobiota bacterium]